MTTACLAAAWLGLVGCGARSGLDVGDEPDRPHDAGEARGDAGAPCEPSTETCNRADDDCDGLIDEALGFAPVGPAVVVRDVRRVDHGETTVEVLELGCTP